jgi:hypothetical protein
LLRERKRSDLEEEKEKRFGLGGESAVQAL